MLKRVEVLDQIKRKNVILISVQNCDKSRIIFVVEMHAKLVKDSNNIQFDKIFTFDNLFNDLFYQKQKILISLCHDFELLIINAKLQIFTNFQCE